MSNSDEQSSVRPYDGVSEVPSDMTPVRAIFKDIRAVQVWLDPTEGGLADMAYLCLPANERVCKSLWYQLVPGVGLKLVTDDKEERNLDAVLAIYEQQRKGT